MRPYDSFTAVHRQYGSNATEPFRASAGQCPLCAESDDSRHESELTRCARSGHSRTDLRETERPPCGGFSDVRTVSRRELLSSLVLVALALVECGRALGNHDVFPTGIGSVRPGPPRPRKSPLQVVRFSDWPNAVSDAFGVQSAWPHTIRRPGSRCKSRDCQTARSERTLRASCTGKPNIGCCPQRSPLRTKGRAQRPGQPEH
jgi:hypothetical protein